MRLPWTPPRGRPAVVRRLAGGLCLLLAGLGGTVGYAELIAEEDFEGYAAGSVDGNAGGSGWNGAWNGDGVAVESVIDTTGAELVYRAPGGAAILGSSRALAIGGNDDYAAFRSLDDNRRRRDVYVSMLVRFTGTQQANDFIALWFQNAPFGAAPNIGLKVDGGNGAVPEDVFVRTRADNHVNVQNIVPGETYFIVGHLSKPNNGRNTVYDEFRLWVNPVTLTEEPVEDAVSRGQSNLSEFGRIGFRSANLDSDDTVEIDRIRLGTTWIDVAAPDIAPVLSIEMDEDGWDGTPGEVSDAALGIDGTAFGGADTANVNPVVPGAVGTCRYGVFDGSNDHVLVPHDARLNGTDTLTYMAWIRPERWSGVQQVMAKSVHGGGSGRAQMGIFSENNVLKLRVETSAGRLETTTTLPTLDTWSHVAGVFTGERLQLYVNGSLAAQTAFSATTLVQTTDPLAIGKRVGTDQYFFDGAIDEVRVYQEALEQGAIQVAMNDTRPCDVDPFLAASAFRIDHDGTGIHCLDEPVQVAALDASGDVLSGYTGEINLSTGTGRGSWSLLSGHGAFNDATGDDGEARYLFAAADDGVATFALSYPRGAVPLDVDVVDVSDPDVHDTEAEGPLTFAPSGFTVTAQALPNPPPRPIHDPLPTATAGAAFPMHITAYGVTDDDPTCGVIESYDGPADLTFDTTRVNPGSGTVLATVDGVVAAGTAAQAVTFAAGQAVVSARYKDVGSLRLGVTDASSFDHVLSGGSNAFVVQPAALVVTRVQTAAGTDNPGAGSATGPAFVPSGVAFEVDVEARDADGDRTPNYGRETPPQGLRVISDALVLPVGGRNGSTGDVIAGAAFAATATPGRFTNDQVAFDEVGVISLRPQVDDGDYLGSGAVPGVVTGPVGRFHPAAYQVIGDVVAPGCGTFTYMDQPALEVAFVLQALNAAGGVTENYDATLLGDPDAVAGVSVAAEGADDGVDRGSRLSPLPATWTAGEVDVNRSDVVFARSAAADGPFDDLQLALAVADELDGAALLNPDANPATSGDCMAAGNCTARALGGPTRVVYGRLAVLPAAGPEDEALRIPLAAQVFTGAAFEAHAADDCSTYEAGRVTLSAYTGNLTDGMTSVVSPAGTASLSGGLADAGNPLELSAPGFGNDGTVDVTLDVPGWLEFDWRGAGLEDPTGTAAFGRFRGHDRIIYWGERRAP